MYELLIMYFALAEHLSSNGDVHELVGRIIDVIPYISVYFLYRLKLDHFSTVDHFCSLC